MRLAMLSPDESCRSPCEGRHARFRVRTPRHRCERQGVLRQRELLM